MKLLETLRAIPRDLWILLRGRSTETAAAPKPPPAKTCTRCGCLHRRHTDDCTSCAGHACRCGRPKTPEQNTCGRGPCKAALTKERKKREGGTVLPMRGRGA